MPVLNDKVHQRQVYDPFMVWRGAWSPVTVYQTGDVIQYSSISYVCIQTNSQQTPPNTVYWSQL